MPEVNYLWDPIEDNVIAEFDEGGGVVAEYTTETGLYGDVVSQRRDGETNCFYSDGLGSTTEVTNAAGEPTATRAYSGFGEITETSGDVVFYFQFVGQKGYYRDPETSELSIRRRGYVPTNGRWLSTDPLSLVEYPYVYSSNSPSSRFDPSGLLTENRTFGSPENGPCGAYGMTVDWVLGSDEVNGYILQLVQQKDNAEACDGSTPTRCDAKDRPDIQAEIKKFLDKLNASIPQNKPRRIFNQIPCLDPRGYVELWRVKNGKVYIDNPFVGVSSVEGGFDSFIDLGYKNQTKGSTSKTGLSIFVSDADVHLVRQQMKDIFEKGINALGVQQAGLLHSSCGNPAVNFFLKLQLTRPDSHKSYKEVKKEWNCCNCEPRYSYMQYYIANDRLEPEFAYNSVKPGEDCIGIAGQDFCNRRTDCQ